MSWTKLPTVAFNVIPEEGERVVKLFPLSPTVATFELSTE